MRWAGPVFVLALALADPGTAAQVHPEDPVPGHGGLTYLDLLKQGLPTLTENPADNDALEGHLPDPPPRHLSGKSFEGEPPDPVTLGWMEAMPIRAGGETRLVVLADLGPDPDRAQSQTLLMLFDDGMKPKLLDMADVGLDLDTEFDETQPKLSLGPGDDALVTVSEHDDADISFDGRMVVFVRKDRFQQIADAFVINETGCDFRQEQTLGLLARPDPGSPYAAVDVVVSHRIRPTTETGCGDKPPKAVRRTFEALYRWDAKLGRFTTSSSALKSLDKLNSAGS